MKNTVHIFKYEQKNNVDVSFHNFRIVTGCCCFLPCLMDGFKDYVHICPKCNAIIGKSTPDDRAEEKKKGEMIVCGILTAVIFFVILCYVVFF